MKSTTLAILFLTAVLVPIIQGCQGDAKSAAVGITIIPPEPTIQIAPISIQLPDHTTETPSLKTIEPNHFNFKYTITNGSTDNVTITAFTLEVVANTSAGSQTTSFTSSFAEFDSNRTSVVENLAPTDEPFTEPITWYIGGLPELPSLRYRGTITFTGYFLKKDDPETTDVDETGLPGDRFRKVVRFTTR